jgi:hypothetical protein
MRRPARVGLPGALIRTHPKIQGVPESHFKALEVLEPPAKYLFARSVEEIVT